MTALIALILIIVISVLIICGVSLNLYMYTRGGIRTRNFRHARATVGPDVSADAPFFGYVEFTDNQTQRYMRRFIVIILSVAVLGVAILILFLNMFS